MIIAGQGAWLSGRKSTAVSCSFNERNRTVCLLNVMSFKNEAFRVPQPSVLYKIVRRGDRTSCCRITTDGMNLASVGTTLGVEPAAAQSAIHPTGDFCRVGQWTHFQFRDGTPAVTPDQLGSVPHSLG